MSSTLPPKKDFALGLLERTSIFVHLDPRRAGVAVPAHFTRQPQLVLQIGLNMPVPIPDLDVSDDGIHCTLSFKGRPHYCVVPWPSVYALIGEPGCGGMVWPEDVPPEVVTQKSTPGRSRPRRRHLRAVDRGEPRRVEDDEAAPPVDAPASAASAEDDSSPPPDRALAAGGASEGGEPTRHLALVEGSLTRRDELAARGEEPPAPRPPPSSDRSRTSHLRLVE